jgi:hypothetical protein
VNVPFEAGRRRGRLAFFVGRQLELLEKPSEKTRRTYLDVGEPGFIRRRRKPEYAGSNPAIQTQTEGSRQGRQPADHPGLNPGMLWVRFPPLLVQASAGHGRAQAAVTRPPQAVQVQLLPDALVARIA